MNDIKLEILLAILQILTLSKIIIINFLFFIFYILLSDDVMLSPGPSKVNKILRILQENK